MHISKKSSTFALALEGDAEIVLQHEIDKSVAMPGGIPHTRVAVLCMEIEHLSGKEAIELVRAHK